MADEHVPMDYYEYDINKVDVGFCTSDDDDQMESPIDSVS